MRQISDETLRAAQAELAKVRKNWLRRPGVTAVDVGYKISGGRMLDELAVRVHVKHKLPPEQLSPEEIFPTSLGVFAVDVIQAEYGPQADALEVTEAPESL